MNMKPMNLAQARHYLEDNSVQKGIRELKQDILAGKLGFRKIGGRYWVSEQDLASAYLAMPQITDGRQYYELKMQGWAQGDIINILARQHKGDRKKARRVAGCYEAHITMGTYKAKGEKIKDIHTEFGIVDERSRLVFERFQREHLGDYDGLKEIAEKMEPRETIHGRVLKTSEGLAVQLPVTHEKQAEPGFFASIFSFFMSPELYDQMQAGGITPEPVYERGGYITVGYKGNRRAILDELRSYISSKQPDGFSMANLEARLFIPSDLLTEESRAAVKASRDGETGGGVKVKSRLYAQDDILKILGISRRQLTGKIMSGKVERVGLGKKQVYYRVKETDAQPEPNGEKLYTPRSGVVARERTGKKDILYRITPRKVSGRKV